MSPKPAIQLGPVLKLLGALLAGALAGAGGTTLGASQSECAPCPVPAPTCAAAPPLEAPAAPATPPPSE